jgi:hypothetical protein
MEDVVVTVVCTGAGLPPLQITEKCPAAFDSGRTNAENPFVKHTRAESEAVVIYSKPKADAAVSHPWSVPIIV